MEEFLVQLRRTDYIHVFHCTDSYRLRNTNLNENERMPVLSEPPKKLITAAHPKNSIEDQHVCIENCKSNM